MPADFNRKGEICREEERLLVVKTTVARFEEVRRMIRELHSYELPEVLLLPLFFMVSTSLKSKREMLKFPPTFLPYSQKSVSVAGHENVAGLDDVRREVDERRDMTDADVIVTIDRMVKQRRESITQFAAGGRAGPPGRRPHPRRQVRGRPGPDRRGAGARRQFRDHLRVRIRGKAESAAKAPQIAASRSTSRL